MSGSYKVAWLCEALLVSAQWLLRLEGATSEAWSTPGREQFFAPTHPGRVRAQSADLWQSTALPCLGLSRETQPHRPAHARGEALCPGAVPSIGWRRPIVAVVERL